MPARVTPIRPTPTVRAIGTPTLVRPGARGEQGIPGVSSGALSDAAMAAIVDDSGSDTTAALAATYVAAKGANVPRTLGKLRNGEPITVAAIGDSKFDPTTPGNTAGSAVEKWDTLATAEFGSVITVSNQAQTGHTMARQFLEGYVALAAAAVPDVVFVNIGTNDTNSDANGPYAAGYTLEASLAALERACAYIRDTNEKAEFVFCATSPYDPIGSAGNTKIVAYNKALRALAAVVGAEFVDLYAAFAAVGSFTSLMYDGTHPGALGNDLAAATIMEHFPSTYQPGPTAALAPRAVVGARGINKVDKTLGALGYGVVSAAGTANGITMALTGGGWTISGNFDVTSTATDSVTISGSVVELLANIDLSATYLPVVDIYLDTVLITADVDLNAQSSKNTTNYWLAPFTGLTAGAHSMKLTLKSGTLRVASAAGVLATATQPFTKETKLVPLGSGATSNALPSDGTYIVTPVIDTVLSLPVGWTSCDVSISGKILLRVNGQTTTKRQINWRVRHASTSQFSDVWDAPLVATSDTTANGSEAIRTSITGMTANTQIRLDARVLSTDKTNCYIIGWDLGAILVRTA